MRCAVLAIVTAVGAAACGGGIGFDDFAAEQRGANCGYYVRCGAFGTVGDCGRYFDRFSSDNPSLRAAVDAGKIHYSESAAQDCVDALDHLDCELAAQDTDALAACDDVFTGTRPIDATCAFDHECISERCVIPDCTTACCQGTCQEPRVFPGLGEPCSTLCDGDLFCGYDQLCHAPLQSGETCNMFTVCAGALYCSVVTNACRERPARGEPCDGYCATEGDVCGSTGVCVEAAVGGEPCSTSNDCSKFYMCNLDTGRCTLPDAPTGSPNGTPCTFSVDCESRYCDAVCSDVPICF